MGTLAVGTKTLYGFIKKDSPMESHRVNNIISGRSLLFQEKSELVNSHVQRTVLATEKTTATQQVSHRPIKCQSRFWSQRGTKSRSTGHISVTTRYSDQQRSKSRQKVMQLYKQWHRPISKRFIKPPYSMSRAASIDSDCCRLPTTSESNNKLDKLRSNQL